MDAIKINDCTVNIPKNPYLETARAKVWRKDEIKLGNICAYLQMGIKPRIRVPMARLYDRRL